MRRRDLNRLDYDFRARKGRLYMPPHSTCDMKGCLDLFLCIDPEVRRIETIRWRRARHDL
jgi:hypothetical protein